MTGIANRLHVALPEKRDKIDRLPTIPLSVIK